MATAFPTRTNSLADSGYDLSLVTEKFKTGEENSTQPNLTPPDEQVYDIVQIPIVEDEEARRPCCVCAKRANIVQKMGSFVSHTLETAFYKLGYNIASRPWTVILLCFLLSAVCGVGMISFNIKDNSEPIWVPEDSNVMRNQYWVDENFPNLFRFNTLMITADNVLSPQVLIEMMDIDRQVKALYEHNNTEDDAYNFEWETICIKLADKCWSNSLLELYEFDSNRIWALSSTQEITDYLKTVTKSPTYENKYNATDWIGGTLYNDNGDMISAKATLMVYVLNATSRDPMDTNVVGPDLLWEKKFIELATKLNTNLQGSIKSIEIQAIRSFKDQSDQTVEGDIGLLGAGICIIICYVAIVMGKFNEVEHKVYLALVGVAGVGLSTLVSYGLASALGQFYGPIHPILPFLLLGLGVDDMFVIIEAWNNLSSLEKRKDLPTRVGLTMKHAGVSITVTSVTDFVAFAIGATTALPALRSFCVYAALGILFLFIVQSTFFVAWLTIDQRRQDATRDACCIWIKYYNFTPNSCSQKEFLPFFLRRWLAPGLISVHIKVLVVTLVACLLGISGYGAKQLSTESDLTWFLPTDSYLTRFLKLQRTYFDDGTLAQLYIGNMSFYEHPNEITMMVNDLESSGLVREGTLSNWHEAFIDWLKTDTPKNVLYYGYNRPWMEEDYPPDEDTYNLLLNAFVGRYEQQYYPSLKWNDSDPTQPRTPLASMMPFKIWSLESTNQEVDALLWFKEYEERFKDYLAFAWSPVFSNWETNRLIGSELYTNLGLAFAAVFVVTLLLVANIWVCCLVCITVIITLVNVCGFMHYWNLTIDVLTSILLILSIGLAIDYSAHIGHTFMTLAGSRNERAKITVATMGSAIINGGFSTFLAFILCATSNSYVFVTFFKVFFLVVVFGLFNGLALLPVLLSWVGPMPYNTATHKVISTGFAIEEKDGSSKQSLSRCDIEKLNRESCDHKVANFLSSLPSRSNFSTYDDSRGEENMTHDESFTKSSQELESLLTRLEETVTKQPEPAQPLPKSKIKEPLPTIVHQPDIHDHSALIRNCEEYLESQEGNNVERD